jgi:hypothetical protein
MLLADSASGSLIGMLLDHTCAGFNPSNCVIQSHRHVQCFVKHRSSCIGTGGQTDNSITTCFDGSLQCCVTSSVWRQSSWLLIWVRSPSVLCDVISVATEFIVTDQGRCGALQWCGNMYTPNTRTSIRGRCGIESHVWSGFNRSNSSHKLCRGTDDVTRMVGIQPQ